MDVAAQVRRDLVDRLQPSEHFIGASAQIRDMLKMVTRRITSYNVCYTKLLRSYSPK